MKTGSPKIAINSLRWWVLSGLVLVGGWGEIPVAMAQGPWVIEEDSVEITSSHLRLPSTDQGTVTILDCVGCRAGSYRLADDARIEFRGQPVSLADLRSALAGGRYHSVFIGIRRTSGEISRLRVYP